MTASLVRISVIVEPDEGRYAEIPREMVASGDWLTPRLNSFKYFEKPALQYWATAIGYELFGQSNATARLWPALIGFLGALWAGFVALRLYGKTAGFYAALITASSLLYVAIGHHLSLDMGVSVFLVIGIGSLALAQQNRDDQLQVRRWMLIGWAALALATLSKGLIGLALPGATLVAYTLWQRDWALWRHLHIGKGLLLFLAITAPWFVAVSLVNPEFAHFFFIHEHFERYTTTEHGRDAPFWYFIPIFIFGVLPWLVVVMKSLVMPRFEWWPKAGAGFDAARWLWLFAVVIFMFFSAGHSKLASYILPMVPVMGILAARRLAQDGIGRLDAWVMMGGALALLAAGARITHFTENDVELVQMYLDYRPWIIASGVVLGLASVVAYNAKLQPKRIALVAGLALLSFQLIFWGFQALSGYRSSHAMADAIEANVPAQTEIYIVDIYYPQSLPFYLQRTIKLVGAGAKGEMEMGIDQEPQKWIASREEFVKLWREQSQAVAIMNQPLFETFSAQGLPMRIIYSDPERIVVVKQ